jgi:hypothetical protein
MMNSITSEHLVKSLLIVLEETFERVYGIYLDKGTSLFETLADITADEASIPVGGKCATLAAQVKHVAFYLDVVDKSVRDPNFPRADWDEIWRTVGVVTPEEWDAIRAELRESYARIQTLMRETPDWTGERHIAGAVGVIAHSAYHLGEIRQALCTLRPG